MGIFIGHAKYTNICFYCNIAAETENNEDTPGPDDSSRPVTETPDVRDITPGGDATPAAEEGEQTG